MMPRFSPRRSAARRAVAWVAAAGLLAVTGCALAGQGTLAVTEWPTIAPNPAGDATLPPADPPKPTGAEGEVQPPPIPSATPAQDATDAAATGAAPTPLADGNPLAAYFIDALAQRAYDGGTIAREHVQARTDAYEQVLISYTSDGIYVTGLMNVPTSGSGPWPVIVLLHGGIDQSAYRPGDGTREHADFFARNGYLTIAPDYRTYNNTEGTGSPLKIPWSIDVLNLIAALPTLPEVDAGRVGLLGHSRGGGVASYVAVLTPQFPQVRAISLYAPLSFDQAVNWERYVSVFGAEWPTQDAAVYGSPATNPDGYYRVSPVNYLERIAVPVQIHHGTGDATLPVSWSQDLYARMRALGKSVEYYEYPGAGHRFAGEDYRLFLQRNLAFFDSYVKR